MRDVWETDQVMEPIQDDIERVRNWLDLAEWSDAAEDFTGGVKDEALAALDRLVAERDRDYADMRKFQAKFIEADHQIDKWKEAFAILIAERDRLIQENAALRFSEREWRDKAQDLIREREEAKA
jgi:hypothetical protein